MDLSRSLVKEFADIANNKNVKEKPSIYVRGTVKMVGAKKFVQLDGSDALTPLTETVDVQDKDRVLVSIENHTATVMGNFTFPPSARKEQEAIDKAEDAQSSAGSAVNTAQEASNKADQAVEQSDLASIAANEAKKHSADAVAAANRAEQNSADAKQSATNADRNSQTARDEAEKAQQAASNAQGEVTRINKEVELVKGDIDSAFTELGNQAAEIQATKETMELQYSKKTEVSEVEANLKTEISKKVGELQTTVEESYAAKNDVVTMEGKLQSQITQNQYGITSAVSKVEKLEADTEDAQIQVNNALSSAFNAQAAADQAKEQAAKAQQSADLATQNATIAQEKATKAQQEADNARTLANSADQKLSEAKTILSEAKENLQNIINGGGSEAEIAEAELKVRNAEIAVNKALTDATEAEYAAQIAQIAADQAKKDATEAQAYATKARAKADNAKIVATEAQKAAEKAQAEVAALTQRVTTAETKINQNTEAISLEANKREEIGNKLTNNYYTKTETDSKFTVESDRITSTVGKVEVVEKYVNNAKNNYGYQYKYDIIINGDANKYYPVIFRGGDQNVMREIFINRGYSEQAPAEWNGHPTAKGIALTLKIKCNFGGWGGATYDWRIHDLNEEYGKLFAGAINVMANMGYAVFLRGGGTTGAIYHIYSDQYLETTWYGGSSPKVWYNGSNDLIGNSGETYKWYAPEPRTYTQEVIEEVASRKYIEVATDAKNTAEKAQEDASGALGLANSNQKQITESMSEITQLSNQISSLVKDEKGNSLMVQDSEGWHFNIGAIQNKLNETANSLTEVEGDLNTAQTLLNTTKSMADALEKKTAFIDLTTVNGQPAIILGQTNSKFKLRITNTSIDFLDGSEAIAYISNQTLYITKAIIKDEIQIGEGTGWIVKRRPNGNLGWRWGSS